MDVNSLSWDEFQKLLAYNNMTWEQARLLENSTPMDKSRTALFVAYTMLLLVGLAGNSWVACVIACILRTSRRTQSPSSVQIYILALCFCDLVVLAFLVFLLLDLAYGQWIVPWNAACQLYLCTESLNKFCGPFILTAMSGYCYYTVCWPEKAGATTMSRNNGGRSGRGATHGAGHLAEEAKRAIGIVCGCLVSVLILMAPVYFYGGIHYVIVHNRSVIKTVLPKCSIQPPENILTMFTIYTFVLGYLVPALSFTYFYTAILFRVRHRPLMHSDSSLHFWRVAKTCLALVLFYVLCWTPYWVMSVYHFVAPLFDPTHRPQGGVVVSYVIHMLPYINCTGYPILYTLINRSIKAAYTQAKEDRKKRRRDRKLRKLDCPSKNAFGTSVSGFGSSSMVSSASCNLLQTNTNGHTTDSTMNEYKHGGTAHVDDETVL